MHNLAPHFRIGIVLVTALAWCGLLIVGRVLWTWTLDYAFLVWNLGLAAIPLFLSSIMMWQRHLVMWVVLGPLWLLFLPNAPYVITDFVHLRAVDSGPLWLDVLMVSSCAGTGLAMGYCSLMQIHSLFIRAKRELLGWFVTMGALFLSGFGIYLGRFLRWHSFDIFLNPPLLLGDVAERILYPWMHFRTWGVTLGFGVFLCIGYAAVMAIGRGSQTIENEGIMRECREIRH